MEPLAVSTIVTTTTTTTRCKILLNGKFILTYVGTSYIGFTVYTVKPA